MRNNDSFATIAAELMKAESVLLFPHVSMDGDAMGSCMAMTRVLRGMNKVCYTVLEDEIPGDLEFLDDGMTISVEDCDITPDVSMCLDCGEPSRFPGREELFRKGKTLICMDHHATSEPFCDFNYIDPSAAATAELVFQLIKEMGQPIDKLTGEAIFAAITTDTGNFQYSNTTRQTHQIAAELYDSGIDANAVSVNLYESIRPEKLMIQTKCLDTMEILGDGKIAVAYVTREMMQECGAASGETDAVVGMLRSLKGVQIAIFLKEKEDALIRVSLRAKDEGNVAAIASRYGGGGHIKAAGATIYKPLKEALSDIKEKALESLRNHES